MALTMGCATSSPVMGPDGTQHVNVKCPRDIANCYEEAAKVCPKGYDVVDKNDNNQVVPLNGGGAVAAVRWWHASSEF